LDTTAKPPTAPAVSSAAAPAIFGAWRVVQIDATGKRALVVCACGDNRQIAVAVLTSGESLGCGCTLTPRSRTHLAPGAQQVGFAGEIASAEHRGGRKRHWGGGIGP
jgi:hypothetical protein